MLSLVARWVALRPITAIEGGEPSPLTGTEGLRSASGPPALFGRPPASRYERRPFADRSLEVNAGRHGPADPPNTDTHRGARPMAWQGSTRAARLPSNWQQLRRTVLERDGHRCTEVVDGRRCTEPATDVDHITAGDDHSLTNLRALCRWHHARKSSSEGNTARRRFTARRPSEPHPGMR